MMCMWMCNIPVEPDNGDALYHVTSGTNDLRDMRGSTGLDLLHLSNTSTAKSEEKVS